MKIFIIIFISLFITKGYANNMEISGIDISQFNEGFKPQDSFYDYVNHNWLSETEILKGSLRASASYDFNESQMQGTREKENIANNSIDQRLLRKLLLKLKAALKSKKN